MNLADYNYTDRNNIPEKYLVNKDDLLISWSATIGFYIWKEETAYLNQHIFKVVEDKSKILRKYFYYLGDMISEKILGQVHGNTMTHITKGRFERIQIPLPPLSVQEEIVAEIDGYQKIIDGARQVVENYKPTIKIPARQKDAGGDPDWELVALGEVIDSKPKNGYSGKPVPFETNLKVLSLSATTKGYLDSSKYKYLDEEIDDNSPYRCKKGDIYLQRGNTKDLVGTAALYDIDDSNFIFPDLMIRIRADENKILTAYLINLLKTDLVRRFIKQNARGSAGSMPKINQNIVTQIPIPLPPLSVQQEIVAQIEEEQDIVNGNKKLIEIFEQKIKDKIGEVWGE